MNSPQSTAPTEQGPFAQENGKAESLISAGDLPAAAGILVKVVEQDPRNWRAFNNMGILSWMQHAWQDAFAMFRKSLSLRPDYSDALMNLFDAALKLHRVDQIVPDLQKALETNPSMEEARIILESFQREGDGVYRTKRALMVGVHNSLIEEADKLLNEGKTNEAMEKYLRANDTQGPSAEAYSGLGIVSYYQNRYLDAFTLFMESIKLNPAVPDTFLNLLDAAKNCDRVPDAKRTYDLYAKEISSLLQIKSEFDKAV